MQRPHESNLLDAVLMAAWLVVLFGILELIDQVLKPTWAWLASTLTRALGAP